MRCFIASLLTVLLTTPRPAAAQSATDSVSPSASSAPAAPCLDNGLHLLVARGTGEPATPGLGSVLSQLSRNITSRVGANATVEAVVYPAEGAAGLAAAVTAAAADSKGVASLQALQGSADALAYAASEREGVRAVSGQLATYLGRCPRGRVALLGFEQGAQAMADALCGTAGPTPQLLGFSQPGIAPDLAKNGEQQPWSQPVMLSRRDPDTDTQQQSLPSSSSRTQPRPPT